jgi:outer membrane protein TolC
LPLFDGGRLQALLAQAHANYFKTVANYRQTVLTACQEVEDNLVAMHRLAEEACSQLAATTAAKKALAQAQAQNCYRGGIVTFLDVVIFENNALQSDISLITIHTRRQVTSIQLIKALGSIF